MGRVIRPAAREPAEAGHYEQNRASWTTPHRRLPLTHRPPHRPPPTELPPPETARTLKRQYPAKRTPNPEPANPSTFVAGEVVAGRDGGVCRIVPHPAHDRGGAVWRADREHGPGAERASPGRTVPAMRLHRASRSALSRQRQRALRHCRVPELRSHLLPGRGPRPQRRPVARGQEHLQHAESAALGDGRLPLPGSRPERVRQTVCEATCRLAG